MPDDNPKSPEEQERARLRWLARNSLLSDDDAATKAAKMEARRMAAENRPPRWLAAPGLDPSAPKEPKASVMTVYVIKLNGLDGYLKVGVTRNLTKRMASFRTAAPLGISVLASGQSRQAEAIERSIHDALCSLGLQASVDGGSEWFANTGSTWAVLGQHGLHRRRDA